MLLIIFLTYAITKVKLGLITKLKGIATIYPELKACISKFTTKNARTTKKYICNK